MLGRYFFVQLHAKAWSVGGYDVTVLPSERLLENLSVEPSEGLNALLDEEIGAAGSDLYVGGRLDWPAVEVWGDVRVVRLRHAGDLLGLEYPPDSPEGGLKYGSPPPLEQQGVPRSMTRARPQRVLTLRSTGP